MGGGFSLVHWIIVLLVVIVLFGASRLPKIGEGLGRGIQAFKKEMKGDKKNDDPDSEKIIAGEVLKDKSEE